MYIILGATGHVGSALAKTLLDKAEPVTIVTHDELKAVDWINAGAQAAVVDVHDVKALHEVFMRGRRLFLLNPPAPISSDIIKEERKTLACILKALEGTPITKVVGESTYGAQPGDGAGDLNVLFEMEEALKNQGLPNSIIRAAYYMCNWDTSIQSAMEEGVIHSLYPLDFKLPMVAADDLGYAAADLITESADTTRTVYVEGPETYSANDVASAFSKALGMNVKAVHVPEDQWAKHLITQGFSKKAAKAMCAMTKITLEQKYERSANPRRGQITLDQYIQDLVNTAAATGSRAPRIRTLEDSL